MSTREVQEIIQQLGVFMFRGGLIKEGMLVARYNIRDAKIEYYFIHTSNLEDYRKAKTAHDTGAHQRLGDMIEANSIIRAQLFN